MTTYHPTHHVQKEFQFQSGAGEKFSFFAPNGITAVRYANKWAKEHGLVLTLVQENAKGTYREGWLSVSWVEDE